ncbi:hypothetical protein [Spirosoma endbachense]|uniref:Oligosaccharide repeat unit polymerase n=1 Tax=Spirosoma endbachense TaxID=2666025 RepID=A0A6P1W7M1_9BACT|nr:hypothetical protein [Spirosoma endbachense]QHV99706.1 hypothetical protein GJR95_33925 [Spirosoma endbachense]
MMLSPDDKNFIRYAALAGGSALISLFLPSNYLLVCTGLLSLTGGLYGFSTLLKSPESRFNFFVVGAVVIVLGSSLGMLLSFASTSLVSSDIWEITIDYAHATTADIALAQAYTNAFAIAFLLIGNRPQLQKTITLINQDFRYCLKEHKKIIYAFVVAILICQIYLLNTGIIVYGGKSLADEGEPTHPLLALISPVVPVLPVVLAYYLRENFYAGQKLGVLLCLIFLLNELAWFFLFGRRSVIFFFLLTLTGIFFDKSLDKRFLLKNIIPILICCYTAVKIADLYHKMRVVYSFEQAQRMSMVDVISGLESADNEKYNQIRNMNVAARAAYSSLALAQFVNLFRTTNSAPLMGQELLNSILFATPSNFLVDKKMILAKEALYSNAYSLDITDISETLYLEAFIDFGWAGFFVYPVFIFLLFSLVYALLNSVRNSLFSLIVACVSFSLALMMIEVDMIIFLSTIRALISCYLFVIILKRRASVQRNKDVVYTIPYEIIG